MFSCEVAQPCSNGFSALVLALQAANVGEGHDVIVPSFTMIATGNAVNFVRANPIFVDNDASNRYNPGWQQIKAADTGKVKAVIICHTYGVPADDLHTIKANCEKRDWILIEDISEVVGVRDGSGQLLGTVGDFAAASMYANKILHAADGGFVLAKKDNGKNAKRLKSLVNHAFTEGFHFVHFENAMNAKINGMGAALAVGVLSKLGEVLSQRAELSSLYRQELNQLVQDGHLRLMPQAGVHDTPWVFGAECKDRQTRTNLRAELAIHGIETRNYFFPQHLQPVFNKGEKRKKKDRLPICEQLACTGFYLPTHTNVSAKEAKMIAGTLDHFFRRDPHNENETFHVTEFVSTTPSVDYALYSAEADAAVTRVNVHFDEYLTSEKTSLKERLLEEIGHTLCLTNIRDDDREMLGKMRTYIELQVHEWNRTDNPCPWLSVDLDQFPVSKTVYSTCVEELSQAISWWVQEIRPDHMLEVGCLFGNSIILMLESWPKVKSVTTIDPFIWAKWMEKFVPLKLKDEVTLEPFLRRIPAEHKDKLRVIQGVIGEGQDKDIVEKLGDSEFDFVLLDFTHDSAILIKAWEVLIPHLIPGKTVVIFSRVLRACLDFYLHILPVVQPLARLGMGESVFRYTGPRHKIEQQIDSVNEEQDAEIEILPRKLFIDYDPGWDHHQGNAFTEAINCLKLRLHEDNAKVVFISAVEQYICDADEILNKPWVGVIHNVVSLPQLFYVPDLERLCSKRYAPWFKTCKGLFTLTELQAKYLKENLHKTVGLQIPIQKLNYPIKPPNSKMVSIFADPANSAKAPHLVVMIGSFLRDHTYFCQVKLPSHCKKAILAPQEEAWDPPKECEGNVLILSRLDEKEYEALLQTSIIFLALRDDGAANTLLIECIARNVPIIAPKLSSVVEYIGEEYPLLYQPGDDDLSRFITPSKLANAICYLESMDKEKLTQEHFCNSIERSTILRYTPAMVIDKSFDVTLAICSYKRTHHLKKIIERLWYQQTYQGKIQIIVWNNNADRSETVDDICAPFLQRNGQRRHMEVIHSTENHRAVVRLAIPPLAKAQLILVCDDDIIPGDDLVSFLMEANSLHPNEVLCFRGHYFQHHKLRDSNPHEEWIEYENLRFADDQDPERLIHFVHSDVAMIPRQVLMDVASVPMPDGDFDMVDDYWISFVASHRFGHVLRKLSTAARGSDLFMRTEDSSTRGLAMHTLPEVTDARMRMYIHHMLQGWPSVIDGYKSLDSIPTYLKKEKAKRLEAFKKGNYVGFNVSCDISEEEICYLTSDLGVDVVRVGAVKSKENGIQPGLGELLNASCSSERFLVEFLERTKKFDLGVVLTLDRRIALPQVWSFVAGICAKWSHVIGYDLVNEPETRADSYSHYLDVSGKGLDVEVLAPFREMIKEIRKVDDVTSIIVEPSYYGQGYALQFLPDEFLKNADPTGNLIVSLHFYEPRNLTWATMMKNESNRTIKFPGDVPLYKACHDISTDHWDVEKVRSRLSHFSTWSKDNKVPLFIGEFGICRTVGGATEYMQAIFDACHDFNLGCMVYSFRDKHWDKMDYEFGVKPGYTKPCNDENNLIFKVIKDAIKKAKKSENV